MRAIAHVTVVAWLMVVQACLQHVSAQTATLQISPVSIQLTSGQMTTTLSVTNTGPAATTVQMRAYQWQQTDGADALTETDDLAVSPPITEIGSNETQTFRLVLRTPAVASEASYRLLLDQLPAATQPGKIRIALRLSLPVFASPPDSIAADVAWRVRRDADGIHLTGSNQGTGHTRIINPTLIDAHGRVFTASSPHGPYILAGASAVWNVAGNLQLSPGNTLRVSANSDTGPVDTTVHIDAP